MPPNFSYLVENKIAGSGHPGRGEHLAASLAELRREGFGAIMTICEAPLEAAMLEEFGFDSLHLEVADFGAPSLGQIDSGVEFLLRHGRPESRVLVHCFGGYGRTGTLLACYLVAGGKSGEEAIEEVRLRRPGSIEAPSQEEAIRAYERHLRGSTARESAGDEA